MVLVGVTVTVGDGLAVTVGVTVIVAVAVGVTVGVSVLLGVTVEKGTKVGGISPVFKSRPLHKLICIAVIVNFLFEIIGVINEMFASITTTKGFVLSTSIQLSPRFAHGNPRFINGSHSPDALVG